MLEKLSHADFQNLDDKTFEIDFGEAGTLTAQLEKTSGFDLEPGFLVPIEENDDGILFEAVFT